MSSQEITLARATISNLETAVDYSDRSSLAALMSDSALRGYETSGSVDWDRLLEDASCAHHALRNVVRISRSEDRFAVVGWSGNYHILLRSPKFRRRADGSLVFDGLADVRFQATDRTLAEESLRSMKEDDLKRALFSDSGLPLPAHSGLALEGAINEMEVLPRDFDPQWLFEENLAYLRRAANTLDGMDQELTAAATRWKLEAMMRGGRELVLLSRAAAHDQQAYKRLALVYSRRGPDIAKAWEEVRRQYYQVEQYDPRFVMDLGIIMDNFMSLAGTIQSCTLETAQLGEKLH
jgi:hypothetical protein